MDNATYIRGKVFTALAGFQHLGVTIPVFDEVVNPGVNIPSVDGANEVYVLLQDQQEQDSAIQTFCSPRFDCSLTVRVVTTWGVVGKKKLSEDIGRVILELIRDERGTSLIDGIKEIQLITAQSISEQSSTNTAFSKVLILNFIKNGN
jgi:hypothetical protein